MNESNKNPLVFNTTVNGQKYATASENAQHCPFCDVDTLTGVLRTDGHKIWLKNKFPTIENSLMTVIIESDKHLGDISTYDLAENRAVFRFAFDCWDTLISDSHFRSVLMFKNFGPRSGGTLRHPHLQIVGLQDVDGYEEITADNFEGVQIHQNDVDITLSTYPIMGFVEFNVIISDLNHVEMLADQVHFITKYLLTDYMNGRCDSYNLFFYHFNGRYICKIVPRFITSPYFIGYKIPQVNHFEKLEEIATELKKHLKK